MGTRPELARYLPVDAVKPLSLLSAVVCCLSAGCGDSGSANRYGVEGHVSIDGASLQKGLIVFIPIAPTDGPKARGIIDQGKYVIEKDAGPYCGEFLVKIETVPPEIEAIAAGRIHGQMAGGFPKT